MIEYSEVIHNSAILLDGQGSVVDMDHMHVQIIFIIIVILGFAQMSCSEE